MSDNTKERALAPDVKKGQRFSTFQALGYSSYRYMWVGQLGHSATMWMEQVVRPLLILEITGSALQVGLVVSVRMIPQLVFGLLAGVIADRFDKRRVLMLSQAVTMSMHLVLAVLLLTRSITVWQIYVTALVSGGSMAFNQPARQSLVPRLVPRAILLNALSLNSAAMNTMRVVGASLAGVLLIFFDYGQIYLLNSIIFLGVIWTTSKIKLGEDVLAIEKHERTTPANLVSDFVDGFRYIIINRYLLYLVALGLLLFIFGQPYQQVFVPLLALNVLEIGRSGAGWMLALSGVGALIGSLTIASTRQLHRRGLILMGFLSIFSAALILLAQSHWFALSAIALIIAGAMNTTYNSLNTSILLDRSPREYHGRVMSLMSLDRGLSSVGAALAGFLAQVFGPQIGLTILAATCIGFTITMFIVLPSLRRIN